MPTFETVCPECRERHGAFVYRCPYEHPSYYAEPGDDDYELDPDQDYYDEPRGPI